MQSRYVQIAERIRGEIASGQYASGARIPAENELARMLDVSRPTVRQALDLLAREGLLVRVKGSGTFVSQSKLVHESTSFVTGYREESRRKNRILRTKVVCLRTQEAGEKVGDALKLVNWPRRSRSRSWCAYGIWKICTPTRRWSTPPCMSP